MIHVIANPTAGAGRAKKIEKQIVAALNEKKLAFTVAETEGPGHATALARQAAERGVETVLSIGGDGTALEVAQGLQGSQTALGIIPAGTGNDFFKNFGLPRSPLEALDGILTHPGKPTDVGCVNGKTFLNFIGVGFDVMTTVQAAKAKKYCHGLLPYLYGGLYAFLHYKPISLRCTLENGEEKQENILTLLAGNGGIFGGGMRFAPDAKIDDGLLDVVIVRAGRGWKRPILLIGLLRGKVLSFPEAAHYRVSSLSFTTENMQVNLDGEIIPMEKADVRILPQSMRIHRV